MTFEFSSSRSVKTQIQFRNFQKKEDVGLSKSGIQEEVEAAKMALRSEIDKLHKEQLHKIATEGAEKKQHEQNDTLTNSSEISRIIAETRKRLETPMIAEPLIPEKALPLIFEPAKSSSEVRRSSTTSEHYEKVTENTPIFEAPKVSQNLTIESEDHHEVQKGSTEEEDEIYDMEIKKSKIGDSSERKFRRKSYNIRDISPPPNFLPPLSPPQTRPIDNAIRELEDAQNREPPKLSPPTKDRSYSAYRSSDYTENYPRFSGIDVTSPALERDYSPYDSTVQPARINTILNERRNKEFTEAYSRNIEERAKPQMNKSYSAYRETEDLTRTEIPIERQHTASTETYERRNSVVIPQEVPIEARNSRFAETYQRDAEITANSIEIPLKRTHGSSSEAYQRTQERPPSPLSQSNYHAYDNVEKASKITNVPIERIHNSSSTESHNRTYEAYERSPSSLSQTSRVTEVPIERTGQSFFTDNTRFSQTTSGFNTFPRPSSYYDSEFYKSATRPYFRQIFPERRQFIENYYDSYYAPSFSRRYDDIRMPEYHPTGYDIRASYQEPSSKQQEVSHHIEIPIMLENGEQIQPANNQSEVETDIY
ncbi:hypothetical protein WR25_22814 isoform B [Diploscapter pachys]|uniref:Uncharacterized protein n=1 Tax=Diploscapter pachys TaxID=2018661 RepID=A0A2A2JJU6_9BILA|nr:hypothetical protein WR25_22814 isoform B [Diploscapter pachys]